MVESNFEQGRGTDARSVDTSPLHGPVVCLGEVMAQVVPSAAGQLENGAVFTIGAAGAESNVAVSLARLKTPAAFAGLVGDDPLGRRIIAQLAAVGVDTRLLSSVPGGRTGLFLKDPSPTGSQVYYYRDGSAATGMSPGHLDDIFAIDPRWLHISGVTVAISPSCAEMADQALDRAVEAGIQNSFDVNFRPSLWPNTRAAAVRLAATAQRAGVVLVGLDEAAALWGVATAEDVRGILTRPGIVVVKNGAVTATAFIGNSRICVPALPIDVREPVGAGDAFAAGWIHGILAGLDDTAALRLGHLTAAVALRSLDDHGELLDPPAVLETRAATGVDWAPTNLSAREA